MPYTTYGESASSELAPTKSRPRLVLPLATAAAFLLAPLPIAAGVAAGSVDNRNSPSTVEPVAQELSGGESLAILVEPPTEDALAPKAPAAPSPVAPQVIERSETGRPEVAITLDADLSEWTRDKVHQGTLPPQVNWDVLDYLEQTGVKSTVFVTGLWAQEYPEAMTRMAANPIYELANHSWNHDAWTSDCYGLPVLAGDPVASVADTSAVIATYTGTWPQFFRFPGLCHDESDVAVVASQGAATVDYDLDGSDAFADNPQRVAAVLAEQAQAGSIVVLHLNGVPNAPYTAQILESLVPALEAKGLAPVTMRELMAQ